MSDPVSDWPRLLSLAVHEFRTPVTVVSGYLRMLLKERAGPLSDMQRRLLDEMEKSCGRLSALLGEMSELGQLEDGRQRLATGQVDLLGLLREVIEELPPAEDQAPVRLDPSALPREPVHVVGDGARLKRSVAAILLALRREIIDGSPLTVHPSIRSSPAGQVARVVVSTPGLAEAYAKAPAAASLAFHEWRGGVGLALPLARRVIELHGGRLLALPGVEHNSSGVIELPVQLGASAEPPG